MDASELAKMMLKWEVMRDRLDEIEDVIKEAVLEKCETVVVGNIRASYSNGRKTYDYKAGSVDLDVNAAELEKYTQTITTTTIDYRLLCKDHKAEDIPFKQGDPSVSVKLV